MVSRINTLCYWILRAFIRLAFRLLSHWEVEGIENIPPHGPFITVSNHLHWLDPPAQMAALPVRINVLAAMKHRRGLFGLPLRLVGAIFVRRGEIDRAALRRCLEVLRRGEVLGIAPEGTRSPTRALQRGRHGAAYLATRTGVPLVPIAVTGVERALDDLRHFRRPHIRVVIGEPFTLVDKPQRVRGAQLEEYTTEIMLRIARLLPPAYRGVYSDFFTTG